MSDPFFPAMLSRQKLPSMDHITTEMAPNLVGKSILPKIKETSNVEIPIEQLEQLLTELITTQERARNAETLVTDLESKLKEANEKIRALEKNNTE